ncbi:MAG: hypothetical protein GX562_05295 [Coriobacteriaceae bacterium]|nr:hypothetical protein [Coriobacteriaceae bacterium]
MFLVTRNELAYLKSLFHSINPLGIFTSLSTEVTGNEAESLTQKGVISNGTLTPLAAATLAIVSNPQVVAQVSLFNGPLSIDKFAYRQGSTFALLEVMDEGLNILAPNGWEDTVELYAQFLGNSTMKSTAITYTMTYEEATTFLALFDIERMRGLSALQGRSEEAVGASVKAVAAFLLDPVEGSLVSLMTASGLPVSVEAQTALTSLVERGIVEAEKETYSLSEETLMLSRRFLAVQSGITLNLLQTAAQAIANATTVILAASPIDIISISMTNEGVEILAISAADALQIIEEVLSCPVILAR